MHTPGTAIHAAAGTPHTAAAVLTTAHAALSAALGVVCLVVWYVIHRHAAHRHPIGEVVAKILLVVGGVILAVTVGVATGWISKLNDTTAGWLSSWSKDPTFTDKHFGILSIVAIIDAAFVAFVTYDLIRKAIAKKRQTGGGSGGSVTAASGRGWGTAEVIAAKYGWFGLGPLAVTIPGWLGVDVLTGLTALAEFVGHLIGSPFGMG